MEKRFEKFTGLIMDISRFIQKIKNIEMARLGLKGKQVQCIFALFNSENGESLRDLCFICGEDKGALSRTIKELELKGLVYTDETDSKKYKLPIKLTQQGQKVAQVVADKISEMFAIGSDGIDDVQRSNLYDTLNKILNNLNTIYKNIGE